MDRFVKGEKVKRKVFDVHNHIGFMEGWKYYGLPEPVSPTVYNDNDRQARSPSWTSSASTGRW